MQALGFVLAESPRQKFKLTHSEEILEQPSHADARRFFEMWDRLRHRGGVVLGRHFPSRAFASLLPSVVLYEKLDAAKEFRVRLAGFVMLRLHGIDIRGKRLSEFLCPAECEQRRCSLASVLHTGRAEIARAEANHGGESMLRRELVSIPVTASDGEMRLVLVASFWNDKRWLH